MLVPNVVVITGPTASGKSFLANALATKFAAEIINGDSLQVFRDFNIGTAKPNDGDFKTIRHHLYSFVDPRENFNSGLFRAAAHKQILDCHKREVLPIIVGGSGLYVRSLLCGLLKVGGVTREAQEKLIKLEKNLQADHEGKHFNQALFNALKYIDPLSAERLMPQDSQRVRRALLVFYSTNRSLAAMQAEHGLSEYTYRALVLILDPDRNSLYSDIDKRVEHMLMDGFINEVKLLLEKYGDTCKALNSIGYRHIVRYLNGGSNYEETVEEIKRDTRRYAKRQLTWWRNQPRKLGWDEAKLPLPASVESRFDGASCVCLASNNSLIESVSSVEMLVGQFLEKREDQIRSPIRYVFVR